MGKIIKDETGNSKITTKARYWVAVGYPENMRLDWKEKIDELLELPFAYCVHDKDKLEHTGDEEDRKEHVHIILAWPGPTTYKKALETFRRLNAPERNAFPTAEPVASIRHKYDYLIHNTDKAKKQGKYQYDPKERITGNNFDIGSYEQISDADRKRMRREIGKLIRDQRYSNFLDLYDFVIDNLPVEYEDVLASYSGYFERICKGVFLKFHTPKE